MRAGVLTLVLFLAFGLVACHHARLERSSASAHTFATLSLPAATKRPDFTTEIKPIFQARCQPCHFPGGKVYDHMPFDRPETITTLGEKLFTRIKDKEEQRLIREFLAQP